MTHHLNVSDNMYDSLFNKRLSANPKARKQAYGTVLGIDVRPPAKPNGEHRRIAHIKFPDGSKTTAYIPMGVLGVTEGSPVLLRASRTKLDSIDLRIVKSFTKSRHPGSPRLTLNGHSYGSVVVGHAQRERNKLPLVELHNGYTVRVPIPKGEPDDALKDGSLVGLQINVVPPASRKKAKKRAPRLDIRLLAFTHSDGSRVARYKSAGSREASSTWYWL